MKRYMYNYHFNITKISVVATVGGAGRACPELTIFAKNSEKNKLYTAQHRFLLEKIIYCLSDT